MTERGAFTDDELRTIEEENRGEDEEKAELAAELRRLTLILNPSPGARDAVQTFQAKRVKMHAAAPRAPESAEAPVLPEPSPLEATTAALRQALDAEERANEELRAGHRKLFDRVRELENAASEALRVVASASLDVGARISRAKAVLTAVL